MDLLGPLSLIPLRYKLPPSHMHSPSIFVPLSLFAVKDIGENDI